MEMLQRWKESVGRRVVVDYVTTNGKIFYAKGFLDEVDLDLSMILITSEDSEEQWFIGVTQIKNLKLKDIQEG